MLGNPGVIKDTGDIVVYEYPMHDGKNGYYDTEGFYDDNSLAARDELKLSAIDPDRPYAIQTRRRLRRCMFLILILCLLVGVIVLTSVLANKKNEERSQTDIRDKNRFNTVGVEGEFNQTIPAQSSGTGASVDVVADASTTAVTETPNELPTETKMDWTRPPTNPPTNVLFALSPTENLVMATLRLVVYDESLLLDLSTSEGQAFASVSAENLLDPQEIIQRYSLLTLYYASQGSDWIQKTRWDIPNSDKCSWYGIGCDQNGQITKVSLSNNRLIGTIPQDVCLLTSMRQFIIPANELVGGFPTCFGNITALQEVHVTGNFLENLPTNLHRLPDLTRLSLASNDFGGSVSELFMGAQEGYVVFPKLQTLDLHSNSLGGVIPDKQLASISTLKAVNLVNNPNLWGSLDTACRSKDLLLATADCDISCSCCKNCVSNSQQP